MVLVYENIDEAHILFLRNYGFVFSDTKTEYEAQRLQKTNVYCVWYNSGKLVIQGKEDELAKITTLLKTQNLVPKKDKQKIIVEQKYNFNLKKHLGSDETLKGDTFGGLVVCGFLYDPSIKDELLFLGIKDSKQLSDKKIVEIAKILLEKYPNRISKFELKPTDYNERTKNNSITKILNEAHVIVAKKLDSTYKHIVDKYPGCNVGDEAITKGEQHSLAIAAASIVARYLGLNQFDELSRLAGFSIPKGSTHVSEALKRIVKEKNPYMFVKMHFKNVKTAIDK